MLKCIFCRQDKIKDRIIYKNKFIFVMLTNIPIVPGHLLICPRRHANTIIDLDEKERKAIFETIKQIRPLLIKIFKAKGFNFAWNEGRDSGQNFDHLHLHVVPRKKGDKGITKYEPRKFLYRPGSRKISPDEELKEIAKILRKNFENGE